MIYSLDLLLVGDSALRAPEMATEGLLWFTNMTIVDPFFLLPFVACGINLLNIQVKSLGYNLYVLIYRELHWLQFRLASAICWYIENGLFWSKFQATLVYKSCKTQPEWQIFCSMFQLKLVFIIELTVTNKACERNFVRGIFIGLSEILLGIEFYFLVSHVGKYERHV